MPPRPTWLRPLPARCVCRGRLRPHPARCVCPGRRSGDRGTAVSGCDAPGLRPWSAATKSMGKIEELSTSNRDQRAVAQLGSALDWGSSAVTTRYGSKTEQRDVAQLGSALDWGSRGRRFKSCHPDRKAQVGAGFSPGLRRFCCPFRRGLWKHPTAGADAFRDASVSAVVTSRDLAGTWSPLWAACGRVFIAEVPSFDWTWRGFRARGFRVRRGTRWLVRQRR